MSVVAEISLALKDRNLTTELKQMKDAVVVASDFGFLPVDVSVLQLIISRWEADAKLCEIALDGFTNLKFDRYEIQAKQQLEQIQSGNIKPIDLITFSAPESVEDQILTIDKTIKKKRIEADDAIDEGDDDLEEDLRSEIKKLRKKKKVLKEVLEKQKKDAAAITTSKVKEEKVDNSEQIAELKKQIVTLREQADKANEEENDDEENRIRALIKPLVKEMRALGGGSRTRKKMVDAKLLDAKLSVGGVVSSSIPE